MESGNREIGHPVAQLGDLAFQRRAALNEQFRKHFSTARNHLVRA
jgi:hypothetical protein